LYENLRKEALEHWQAGRWQAAADAYYQVAGLQSASPEDAARLVTAAHHAGHSLEIIAALVKRVTPEALAILPNKAVLSLLDDLSGNGFWAITDQYASLGGEDRNWQENYTRRRSEYLEALAAEARHALSAVQWSQAEAQANRVLEIEPEHAE